MQLRYAEIVTQVGMQVGSAVLAHMVVTMIAVLITLFIYLFVIGDHCPTLGTGNDLYKIEGESTRITYSAYTLAFVCSAYGLAGIFEQQQFVCFAYSLQLIHLRHAAAHMHRHYGLGTRRNSCLYSSRAKGKRFININHHRYSAYG